MAAFPLMALSNEMLAGVTQRLSEAARRQLECVNRRLDAVTRAHGYIYRHELDITLYTIDYDARRHVWLPAVSVCGFDMELAGARAAVVALLAHRRRVTHVTLDMSSSITIDEVDRTAGAGKALADVLVVLLGSDRLRLTSVKLDASFGRGIGDVEASVARLVQRHAATMVDMRLTSCADEDGDAAAHAHVQLRHETAACTAMQRFSVSVGRHCLRTVAHDCLPGFKQLRALDVEFHQGGELDLNALPRPSQLIELRLGLLTFQATIRLLDAAQTRPDVFAPLHSLAIDHKHDRMLDNTFDQLHAYSPLLEELWVKVEWFDNEFDVPRVFLSLVAQFFAAPGPRRLRLTLVICWTEVGAFEGDVDAVWSFEEACAELLSAFYAAVPAVSMDCSEAHVFVLTSAALLKAAVAANPANAAVVGGAFAGFLQAQPAGAPAYNAVLEAGGSLLVNGTGRRVELDYAVAAPFYTAVMAATGVRVQLAPALANGNEDVAVSLTRGGVAFGHQLDIVFSSAKTNILPRTVEA